MTAATTVVAATKPELVEDLATTLLETLRAEDPRRRTAALESLKTLSEHQPRILIDALPTIETILKDGRTSDQRTASMLFSRLRRQNQNTLNRSHQPLLTFIEDRTLPIRSSAIVGHLAKARPDVAVPAIETFAGGLIQMRHGSAQMGSLSSQTWLRHIPRNSVHTRHKHANFSKTMTS